MPKRTLKAATASNSENVMADTEFLSKLIVGIGEVSAITGIPQRQLRYWQAKGIIRAVSNDSATTTRRFDYLEIKKILLIKDLLDEGYTLEAAAQKVAQRMAAINNAFLQIKKNKGPQ